MSLCPFVARVSTHFPFFSISYRINADLQGMVTKCAGFRVDAWEEIDGTSKIGLRKREREEERSVHVEKSFWLFSLRIKLFRPFTAKSHYTSVHVAELPGGSSGSFFFISLTVLYFPKFSQSLSLVTSYCFLSLWLNSTNALFPLQRASRNHSSQCS